MERHRMDPIAPTGPQLAGFHFNEDRYSDGLVMPDLVVMGDSRSKMLGIRWAKDAGADTPINIGVSGFTVQNWLWQLDNTRIDMSQAHTAVVEIGINNQRRTADDIKAVAAGILQGVHDLSHKLAVGADIYVIDTYACRPGTQYFDPAANDWLNRSLFNHAPTTGFVFVEVALDFGSDYRDNIHLNDSGNAKVTAALVEAMEAHGDLPPESPHTEVIGLTGFDPLTV